MLDDEGFDAATLVAAAVSGDQQAWNALVGRYAPLVWGVCRSFRLSEAETADVSQTVWLRTVERLDTLRTAAAVPGWLSTVTRNECLHLIRGRRRTVSLPEHDWLTDRSTEDLDVDTEILAAERRAMVRDCLAQLPETCRRLLTALVQRENPSYEQVSAELGMPIGSIGPTRSRCLTRLRRCNSLRAWQQPVGVG